MICSKVIAMKTGRAANGWSLSTGGVSIGRVCYQGGLNIEIPRMSWKHCHTSD